MPRVARSLDSMTSEEMTLPFTKGHGTRNDFVLLDDRDAQWDLSPAQVRALCDRHGGIVADGVIRLVPIDAVEKQEVLEVTNSPQAQWLMDYRNADGTVAQMCGNGVRVFTAFAEHLGLVDFDKTPNFPVATRSGVKMVRKESVCVDGSDQAWFAVDMGQWTVSALPDAQVHVRGAGTFAGTSADLGNPHTVVHVPDVHTLTALDLSQMPQVEPLPAQGTNVEFVALESLSEPHTPQSPSEPHLPSHEISDNKSGSVTVARIAMRVYERGVGETQSCGTGCCAAALVSAAQVQLALARSGQSPDDEPDVWMVDIPGGGVRVRKLPGHRVELAGPAQLTYSGTINLDRLTGPQP